MEHNSIIGWIPWPVALATAAWFGTMAYRGGKNFVLWAIGGGMLGLIVTTLVLGLAQATFLPFSTGEIAPFRMKMAALAVFLVLGIGWLFTGTLHRHLLTGLKPAPAPAPAPPETPAKPPATGPKP
jgi:hypothetical protein